MIKQQITNLFLNYQKLVLGVKQYCSEYFSKILIVYGFSDFFNLRPKWNSGKDVSARMRVKEAK